MTLPCPPLSVIIPTGNRIDVIEDCLRSVRWAAEVIVVDSFSSDGTLDIAQQYADRVLQHEYESPALQKNWAIPQASHDWVLMVDTDERVSPTLRDEISQVLSAPDGCVGFRMPRLNYLLGKPLQHASYYPDYQIRLFRRDCGHFELRQVHEHLLLDGPCGTLQTPLIHYAHRSLDQTIQGLLVMWTTGEAEQRRLMARSAGQIPTSGLAVKLLLRPLAAFGLRYLRYGGWRDGIHGLVISLLWGMYVAITYMKIWEGSLDLSETWWVDNWETIEGEHTH